MRTPCEISRPAKRNPMPLRLSRVFIALLLFSAVARADIVRTSDDRIPIDPSKPALLDFSTFAGSLTVKASDSPEIEVHIRYEYAAKDPAKADQIRRNLTLHIGREGNGAKVTAEYSRDIHWTFESWPPVRLAFTITVPRLCNLKLVTRDGGIAIGEVKGHAEVKTGYGLIYFKGLDGDIVASSDFGDIVVAHCTGNLKLRSVSGNFRVGPVGGFADVFGYGGQIEVESAGDGVRAETSGADLICGFSDPIVAPATLITGGANMLISLHPHSACTLDLKASIFGRIVNVKNKLVFKAVSGGIGHSRAVLELNGGGPKIRAKAGGGSIYLEETVLAPGKARPVTPYSP